MKIVIGSDRFGYSYKYSVIQGLLKMGHYVADVGMHDNFYVDFPDIVASAAKHIITGEFERLILLSATGIGMSIAANKITGIYAAACHEIQTIQESILVNCNVLCIGTKFIDNMNTEKLIEYWLTHKYDSEGEYAQIVSKIKRIEEDQN